MNHTSRSMEDSGAKSDLNYVGLDHDISREKNFSLLPRGHSCDTFH